MADNRYRFDVLWANHEPMYRAIVDYGKVLLARVPSMTDQTIGVNVLVQMKDWQAERRVHFVGWGDVLNERAYPVADWAWDELAAISLGAINAEGLGEEVRSAVRG